MAQSNKRYFNTFFFEDPYIEDLDYHIRYLYLTMILNPHNNLAGVYEISINKLINYTGLPEDKVRLGIQKLQEDRKILFSGNWLALKNFIKNNELNPNMCKKSFDIMKAAPKEKIIFIISDQAGNAEPWLNEFIVKVEKGINASIDSKNRNALKFATDKKLPEPIPEQHQIFTIEHFRDTILSVKKDKIGGTLPPTLPPSIAIHRGEPSGEYKEEIEVEYEIEVEKEREIEVGKHGTSTFQGFQSADSDRDYSAEYKTHKDQWNSLPLPQCRKLPHNIPNWGEILNSMQLYTPEEITASINNYAKLQPREKAITYSTFPNFLIKGIEKYADSSKPYDTFKETEEEKKNVSNKLPRYVSNNSLTNEEQKKGEEILEKSGGLDAMFRDTINK